MNTSASALGQENTEMNFGLAYSTWNFLPPEEEVRSMQFVTTVDILIN